MNVKEARQELAEFFYKQIADSMLFIDIVIIGTLMFYVIFKKEYLFICGVIYVIGEFIRLRKHHSDYLNYKD